MKKLIVLAFLFAALGGLANAQTAMTATVPQLSGVPYSPRVADATFPDGTQTHMNLDQRIISIKLPGETNWENFYDVQINFTTVYSNYRWTVTVHGPFVVTMKSGQTMTFDSASWQAGETHGRFNISSGFEEIIVE